jgi:hypothetical protein
VVTNPEDGGVCNHAQDNMASQSGIQQMTKLYFSDCEHRLLVDRRRQSSIPDVRSFRGADCDTDHYLVAAKLGER